MGEVSGDERLPKKRRITSHITTQKDLPHSLTGSVSPPPLRRQKQVQYSDFVGLPVNQESKTIKSPFQLTWVRDLPESSNVDAITLKDILGDPLIAECWEFNYMHDVDYLMSQFDPDVKDLVKVHIVHGFWKQEDNSRLRIKEQASSYTNVTIHTAYMPEMFGTHHSKMIVLIRHDSTAQVIIHTANLIEFDWTNMTQAVWRSPLLPLVPPGHQPSKSNIIGSGSKFKGDLLNYFRAYDTRRTVCKPLIDQLIEYDFSSIRAALVASIPSRLDIDINIDTKWGWPALQKVLSTIPAKSEKPDIIVQVSSIATLGATDKWLDKTLFKALSTSKNQDISCKPCFKVMFPTADEIRRSLNGYRSGSAIHIKLQSAQQAKQLQYLKPLFCHWAGDGSRHTSGQSSAFDAAIESVDTASSSTLSTSLTPTIGKALRRRAAPHIKTYTRFSSSSHHTIDWMLVTSANLSKQAWGEGVSSAGEVRVCSYEIGVLVWPALWGEDATLVPTFGSDTPIRTDNTVNASGGQSSDQLALQGKEEDKGCVIGARMPYDLPTVPYVKDDEPWCATKNYAEPDWKGLSYIVG